MDLMEYTNVQILRMLGPRFRSYRLALNMTQKEMALRSGMSEATLRKFESGRLDNMNMTNFMSLLRQIGKINCLDELLPEMPESPYYNPKRMRASNEKSVVDR